MIRLVLESRLAAPPEQVWTAVSAMKGVNAELHPWVHMTSPRGIDRLDADDTSLRGGFRSWILVLGVIPVDRHHFGFDEIGNRHFAERSRSWLNRTWRHNRTVSTGSDPQTSSIRDELEIVPRIRALRPLVRTVVRAVFRHRHRRLRRAFGETAA